MSGSVGRLGFLLFGKGKGQGHDDILDKSPLYKGVQSGMGWMGIWVQGRGIELDRIGEDGVCDYGWAWALARLTWSMGTGSCDLLASVLVY